MTAGPGPPRSITTLTLAVLFPVYYNVLSQFVTRRDELVLKRLRTGEIRDLELLGAMALPGVAVAVVVSAIVTVPVAMALGQAAPLNPVVYAADCCGLLRPVRGVRVLDRGLDPQRGGRADDQHPGDPLAVFGQMSVAFPEEVQRWVDLTPGAAMTDLVRVGWFGFGEPAPSARSTSPAPGRHPASRCWCCSPGPRWRVWLAARSMQWEPRT